MHASWKAGGIAVLVTFVSVTLAYQFPAVLELDLGKSFPSGLLVDDFHDPEPGYRWTRARSSLRFPDLGATRGTRVELQLSGFRPPGLAPPLVVVETSGSRVPLELSRRVAWYSFDTRTEGWWSSDLEIGLRSETFTPGAGDERALGVRVHRVRVTLPGGAVPPLRQLLSCLVLAAFVLVTASSSLRRSRSPLSATRLAAVVGIALATGYALARTTTALFIPVLAVLLIAVTLVRWLTPSVAELARELVDASVRAFIESLAGLVHRSSLIVVLLSVASVWAGYRFAPIVELDLGSGRTTSLTRRFGPLDRDGEVTFRQARAGASIDLRDFGSLGRWTITIRASARGGGSRGVVLRAGGEELLSDVSSEWSTYRLDVPPPSLGWRGGYVLSFPGLGAGVGLLVDRVEIDRGSSLPGLRSVALVVGVALLLSAALGSTVGAMVFLPMVAWGLASDPVVVTPFLPTLFLGAVAAVLAGAITRGALEVASRRDFLPELAPAAVAVALAGFVVGFAAMASPLYVGGHYGFHTDIAEEISQGQFLRYYLPYPGSMLSRQPQWNHVIVPHSCLFHTLVSPLALLPRNWFHSGTKLFLATLLLGVSVSVALVATRVGGARSGVYAALASAFGPTGLQLLGLGHLMTLFGTWASTLALGFIVIHAGSLSHRRVFAWALGLLSLCFLSYTGSLLFGSLALGVAAWWLHRSSPTLSKNLVRLVVLAWAVSFVLYYIHWTLPFVRDSLPSLLGGVGSDAGIDVWARVASEPRKLSYTFGSFIVPAAGVAGLALALRTRRVLLGSWGSILVVFTALDIGFNFLLKHHYFTYPVVAIGLGLGLDWIHEKRWPARAITVVLVVSLLWMGFREVMAVATGGA